MAARMHALDLWSQFIQFVELTAFKLVWVVPNLFELSFIDGDFFKPPDIARSRLDCAVASSQVIVSQAPSVLL